MSHLHDVNMSYFQHWYRAWKVAFVLIVHGVCPNIWEHRATEILHEDQ